MSPIATTKPWLRPSTALSKPSRSSSTVPWRDADQVERAVAQWVCWYNTERLHSALGYLPPEESEVRHHRSHAPSKTA
ncbi:integrase core domain-containing protein [Streptomyces sp. NPDC086993]|uniref:integrase core domain-containing protein n=1 Tax=Streptomyces sp. NPDC086993 TaxID=3365765 RepID=UPI00380DA963